ncbi:hypothetical protein [Lonepinella sp. BR2882]|uniref:hypothetical protein n=1 Tax=Lonepinella sp. BR2882 TaxID=3095283 RepID=UPI003F6DA622
MKKFIATSMTSLLFLSACTSSQNDIDNAVTHRLTEINQIQVNSDETATEVHNQYLQLLNQKRLSDGHVYIINVSLYDLEMDANYKINSDNINPKQHLSAACLTKTNRKEQRIIGLCKKEGILK